MSPEQRALLQHLYDQSRASKKPEAIQVMAELKADSRPWILDELLEKGFVADMGGVLWLTLEGLEALGTPEAAADLERSQALYEALRRAYVQDPAGRHALEQVRQLMDGEGAHDDVERLLGVLSTLGVIGVSQQGGAITSVSVSQRIFDVDPFQGDQPTSPQRGLPAMVSFSVRNFRGISHAEWAPEGVSLLAGPNGSGKSTLLEALAFLRNYLTWDLAAALQAVGTSGLRYLNADKKDPITFTLRIDDMTWEVRLGVDGANVHPNPGETFTIGDRVLFRRAIFSHHWYLQTKRWQVDGGRCCLRLAQEHHTVESQRLQQFVQWVQEIHYYQSYDLQQLRQEVDPANGDALLHPSGRNLYAVLRNWRSAPRRFEGRFEWVMTHLRAAFPDTIDTIEFDDFGQTVNARFYPVGALASGQSLPMNRASDGMLVGLLHLTAVAGAKDGALIAIDEMENQLHPLAIQVLLSAMRERAEEKDLLIILTTHSPVLMNLFKHHEDQFFVIEPGASRLPVPLNELKDPDWLANFALGKLYERMAFGAPAVSREE